jgi:pyruvate kinase
MNVKLPNHKTKIVCTIGPASRSESVIKKLINAGMNVARLNFSHGNKKEHRENIKRIRTVATKLHRVITIIGDLPGPKIRIGKLKNEPVVLKKDDTITLTTKNILGSTSKIAITFKELPKIVSQGSVIYLNDGFIQLKVKQVVGDTVRCKVITGGQLFSKKGVGFQKIKLSVNAITEKDLELLDFGIKENVDAFSVSFVKDADDIKKVKGFAQKKNKHIYVVAKIEREEALINIDKILEVTDAIMVARGDLGIDIPIEDIPVVQKNLIYKANLLNRPVITATQMLESMINNIRPTRAEATDVANAILDGTDAVMLSEETAVGNYPVETVKMMSRIAKVIEQQRYHIRPSRNMLDFFRENFKQTKPTIEDVISLDVIEALRTLAVRFILTPTRSGSTARRISRFKPESWILSLCSNKKLRNFLNLSYGVYPLLINEGNISHRRIIKFTKETGLLRKGDTIILTEGIDSGKVGETNSIRIINLR